MSDLRVETTIRVRYAETDQMGVVYYANYLVWMEVARVTYCREAGFEYRDMERDSGAFLAVTKACCHYRTPARFDDVVSLQCWVTASRSRTVVFAYEMRRDGELLATGQTHHTVIDRNGKMIRLPERYRQYFPLSK